MKNQFDKNIKQALDGYEQEYNSAHWNDLKHRMNKPNVGKALNVGKGLGLAAIVCAVVGAGYYFGSTYLENNKVADVNIPLLKNESNPISVQNNGSAVENTLPSKQLAVIKSKEIEFTSPPSNSIDNTDKVVQSQAKINSTENEKKTNEAQTVPAEVKLQVQDQPIRKSDITPVVKIKMSQNSTCIGDVIQFTTEGLYKPQTIRWDFGDGQFSTEQSPKHLYKEAGNYSVKLQLNSDQNENIIESKDLLVVHSLPTIDIYYTHSIENPSEIIFDAKSDGNILLNWNFGDQQKSSEQTPTHLFNKKGDYEVNVTAKNNFGCTTSARKLVAIENDFNLFAPNAFSPNGDGQNDTWIPKALLSDNYNFTLFIYDASNKVVYTTDNNKPWDGAGAKVGDQFSWKETVKDIKTGKSYTYFGTFIIVNTEGY